MSKKVLSLMAILMVISFGFFSCEDDENDDLTGYWVKENHLNNPERGKGGYVRSVGYQFLGNGEVRVLQIQHTGHSSRYYGAEADTSWEKLTERNGVSFYINPNYSTKNYQRSGNEIYIDVASNPVIMTITGGDRIVSTSADEYSDGVYVRVKK
ncbi:MAG: hypothetical protein IJ588_04010 [Prevotella sp.]|nr:hypothetical protein [Prevotella sp.]